MEEDNNKKDIEVVQGIGNLDISPVFDNITSAKPKMQDEKPKNIFIPQVKKNVEKEEKTVAKEIDEKKELNEQPLDEKDKTIEDLNDFVEEDELDSIENSSTNDDSELVEGEQIEFEDIDLDDPDLDDDIDEADSYSEE